MTHTQKIETPQQLLVSLSDIVQDLPVEVSNREVVVLFNIYQTIDASFLVSLIQDIIDECIQMVSSVCLTAASDWEIVPFLSRSVGCLAVILLHQADIDTATALRTIQARLDGQFVENLRVQAILCQPHPELCNKVDSDDSIDEFLTSLL